MGMAGSRLRLTVRKTFYNGEAIRGSPPSWPPAPHGTLRVAECRDQGAHPGTPSDQVRVGQYVRGTSGGGLRFRPGDRRIRNRSRTVEPEKISKPNRIESGEPWYWEYLYREDSAFGP